MEYSVPLKRISQLHTDDKERTLISSTKWKKQGADIVYNMLYTRSYVKKINTYTCLHIYRIFLQRYT